MATIIGSVKNDFDTPVAYLGESTLPPTPTGWTAWGFAPNASHEFGWTVEGREKKQALVTKAGVFYIFDDGHWNILYEREGSSDKVVLVRLKEGFLKMPRIVLTVEADGCPSAVEE